MPVAEVPIAPDGKGHYVFSKPACTRSRAWRSRIVGSRKDADLDRAAKEHVGDRQKQVAGCRTNRAPQLSQLTQAFHRSTSLQKNDY